MTKKGDFCSKQHLKKELGLYSGDGVGGPGLK
jgi:hypothetical protein